jgi:hypothetical protein
MKDVAADLLHADLAALAGHVLVPVSGSHPGGTENQWITGNTVHFVGQTIAFRGLSPLEPGRQHKVIVCPTLSG